MIAGFGGSRYSNTGWWPVVSHKPGNNPRSGDLVGPDAVIGSRLVVPGDRRNPEARAARCRRQ